MEVAHIGHGRHGSGARVWTATGGRVKSGHLRGLVEATARRAPSAGLVRGRGGHPAGGRGGPSSGASAATSRQRGLQVGGERGAVAEHGDGAGAATCPRKGGRRGFGRWDGGWLVRVEGGVEGDDAGDPVFERIGRFGLKHDGLFTTVDEFESETRLGRLGDGLNLDNVIDRKCPTLLRGRFSFIIG